MFCCFSQKQNLDTQINNDNEDKCVRISSPRLLETRSIYDSIKLDTKWDETKQFIPPIERGVVIKVYDGDTITIASKLPYPESPLYRLSVRLNGIDTPEIKGKSEDEKLAAKNARDALANLIYGKQIRLENVQSEKYGRILADVYLGELHLNRWLINNRYAVAYDGGTKKPPASWLKYKECREV